MFATLRLARPGDETALESFLKRHADSSLYLRFFFAQGGLVDEGKALQRTYAVADVDGEVVGAVMHNWQGGIFLQVPDHAGELAKIAVARSRRPLVALLGPSAQVERAHEALGDPPVQKRSREGLFALNLSKLVAPAVIAGSASCRRAGQADLGFLREWRFQYELESTGLPDAESTRAFAAEAIDGHVSRGEAFVLKVGGVPVALCAINACASESVQIGGVWTPPALRGKGYARRVVAGALKLAEADGVKRAVLFTENPAACRSYAALGFRQIGEYAITIYPP